MRTLQSRFTILLFSLGSLGLGACGDGAIEMDPASGAVDASRVACTPVTPGTIGNASPPACDPQPQASAQPFCGVASVEELGPFSGVIGTLGDSNDSSITTLTLHMTNSYGPIGIISLNCGAFAPGTYTDAVLNGAVNFEVYSNGSESAPVKWTTQLDTGSGCDPISLQCGPLPAGSVTLVITSVGPAADAYDGASTTHGTLSMVLTEFGTSNTSDVRIVF